MELLLSVGRFALWAAAVAIAVKATLVGTSLLGSGEWERELIGLWLIVASVTWAFTLCVNRMLSVAGRFFFGEERK